ncbi:phosphatase PAP2 family protein [Marinihelvus fidelis]|uniref:undecaprenyl-diphosphate phosphatase n=1 Tax=Marinihelvus fidelis TaxID=2613842 RepID=A0A5N0TGJ3_9GAMM|nr:phosphatase PAP2 family protein [Marinihelvus fidelis]KAA9133594.1 phosphatase PAP2 family protein [Marinihelvus fidelis]
MMNARRFAEIDLAVCQQVNRACAWRAVRRFFRAISQLGDGKFWYVLMLVLPALHGRDGLVVSLRMALAGVAGVAIYKLVKHVTHRQRPYVNDATIMLGAAPLDQYSFPSGHTLHAVSFTLIVCAAFPVWAWLLVPFAALVAASRVILGLHYPTDVLLGATIGALVATGVASIPLPT